MMKLWRKGYDLDGAVERYTVGEDFELDRALVPYDCRASMAHAGALRKAGVLTAEEAERLRAELGKVIALHEEGNFIIRREDEDGHTALENHLVNALGDLGKKIHTARSRNDQVVTAIRLYAKDRLREIDALLDGLTGCLHAKIAACGEVPMPGYTHGRKAMPSSVALWMGAFVESLADDRELLQGALRLIDQNPLGTGAGYGIPVFELDREGTAKALGFSRVQNNPLYVQNSRGKFEGHLVFLLAEIMGDLNRLASDLLLFTMEEFAFFSLPEELCTGSSIMPQKRNPDVLEILRARYHQVLAHAAAIQSLTANLPSGYHRDLQLTKKPLMESFAVTEASLAIMALVVEKLQVDEERCKAACTGELRATEEAYRLVKEGMPFRDAYRKVAERLREEG